MRRLVRWVSGAALVPRRSRGLLAWGVVALCVVGGCDGERLQSMLHPAGPAADEISRLWWVMFAVYSTVFVLTMLALVLALRAARSEEPVLGNRFIATAGIFVPLLILVIMLVYTIRVTVALEPRDSDLHVRVIGHQFWWEVHYPEHGIITANELHIPAGASVELELVSADVIHSFWVPELAQKMDLMPDHPNRLWIEASRPGVYRGQCAEYCGTQHARMAFHVVALPADEFDAWVRERQAVTTEPRTATHERGQEVFASAGCGACHGISGVSVATEAGPDLTHVGSRRTLGAGTVANTEENLRRFIRDPHQFKPGVLMPAMPVESDDMDDLVAYLRSLE